MHGSIEISGNIFPINEYDKGVKVIGDNSAIAYKGYENGVMARIVHKSKNCISQEIDTDNLIERNDSDYKFSEPQIQVTLQDPLVVRNITAKNKNDIPKIVEIKISITDQTTPPSHQKP